MPQEVILLADVHPNEKNKNKVWSKGSHHKLTNRLADKLIGEGKAEVYKPGKRNKKVEKPFKDQK